MANRLIMPICSIVRSCAFALMSFTMASTGSYTVAYGSFIAASAVGVVLVWLIGSSGDRPLGMGQSQSGA
ncbi:MAG: hypothetical protein LBS32_02615 [Clostridiales Family XIII bacterium]|nr:hypothetical protein [Clostridiales Family XIII bacterium]